jgi:membrane protease subunit HflC
MRRWWWLSVPVLLLWGATAFYTVDVSQFVYVTEFGRPVVTHDGASAAGLHLKAPWPVQSVTRLDRRLQVFDLPAIESLTRDPQSQTIDKTLTVDAFVCWRIPDAPSVDRFIRTVGSIDNAQRLLGQRISGQLGAVISTLPLDELISVADAGTVERRSERLRRQLLGVDSAEPLIEWARSAYGIELVEVRLRRFNYPESVRASLTERIRSERAKKVADYESAGRRKAAEIISAADKDARIIEAQAKADAERMRADADAKADALRNEAHSQDREFYTFLHKLKAYRTILSDTRDMLLLSTRHEWFDVLFKPPPPAKIEPAK